MHHENVNALLAENIYKGTEQPTYMDMTKALTKTVSGKKIVEKPVNMVCDDFDFSDDDATTHTTILPARRSIIRSAIEDSNDTEENIQTGEFNTLLNATTNKLSGCDDYSNNQQRITHSNSPKTPQPLETTNTKRRIQKKQSNVSNHASIQILQTEGSMLPPTPRTKTVITNIDSNASETDRMIALLNRNRQSNSNLTTNILVDDSNNGLAIDAEVVNVDDTFVGTIEELEEDNDEDDETGEEENEEGGEGDAEDPDSIEDETGVDNRLSVDNQ